MAEKLAKLMDNVNELLDSVLKEQEKQKQILEQLNNVEEPYRIILIEHYIQGKNLVEVANILNYSYERIKHLNGIALLEFDKVDTK